jgi:hypothetical protein
MHRTVFLYIWLLTVVLLLNAMVPSNIRADGIRFFGEFQYNSTDSDTKIKDTGEEISSEFTRFDQRYDLDISKTLYPYLLFATGTVYEHRKTETTTGDLDFDTTEKILRPFVELNLNNPIYQAGMSYRKSRIEEEITDLQDSRLDRDQYTAILGMTPSREFPEWNFAFIRTLTWDDPETVDRRLDVRCCLTTPIHVPRTMTACGILKRRIKRTLVERNIPRIFSMNDCSYLPAIISGTTFLSFRQTRLSNNPWHDLPDFHRWIIPLMTDRRSVPTSPLSMEI